MEPPPLGWKFSEDLIHYVAPDGQEIAVTDTALIHNYVLYLKNPEQKPVEDEIPETTERGDLTLTEGDIGERVGPPRAFSTAADIREEAKRIVALGPPNQEDVVQVKNVEEHVDEQGSAEPTERVGDLTLTEGDIGERVGPSRPLSTAADIREEAARIAALGPPSMDDIVKHVEEHVGIHYDEEGNAAGLTLHGETFVIDGLFPPETQDITPDVMNLSYGTVDPLQKLETYLEGEEYENIEREELVPENFPDIAWNEGLPVLYEDEQLEERLGLSEGVQAIMTDNGVVHQMFSPFMHGIATEGLRHD